MKGKFFLIIGIVVVLVISGCVQQSYVLEGERIEGYVYAESGKPIPSVDMTVSYTRSESEAALFHTDRLFQSTKSTDENGYFFFNNYQPRKYNITVSIGEFSQTKEIEVKKGTERIDFHLPFKTVPNGSIKGYVKDYSNKPINGVSVYEQIRGISTKTDENGYFILENMEPGRAEIKLSANGYQTKVMIESVRAGLTVERAFDLATVGTGTGGIIGVVLDEKSDPMANIEVFTMYDGEFISKKTNASGHYEFEDLSLIPYGTNSHRITAIKQGYPPRSKFVRVSPNVKSVAEEIVMSPTADTNSARSHVCGYITVDKGSPTGVNIKLYHLDMLKVELNMSSGGFYNVAVSQSRPWPDTSAITLKISATGYEDVEAKMEISDGETIVKNFLLSEK